MKFKQFLGRTKHSKPEPVYLNGFSWDCGWYWSGGHIGNGNFHAHFDGAFLKVPDIRGHVLGNFITPWTQIREKGNPDYVIVKTENTITATHKTHKIEYRIVSSGCSVWEPIEIFLDDVPEHISKNWWRIKDLYKQFYALREAAEVFKHGGNCTNQGRNPKEINPYLAKAINEQIELVLIPEIVKVVVVV